jgi:hypothetical protein
VLKDPGSYQSGGLKQQQLPSATLQLTLKSMSEAANTSPVAEALSSDESLGSRDDWWHDEQIEDGAADESGPEPERVDPNNPNEIVAHQLLRETGTMLCASTLFDDPGLEGGQTAELFVWLDDEDVDFDPLALHTENKPVGLTDPAVRLGQHDTHSSLVGEWGTERHRKRFNPETGYLSGDETTKVIIQDRSVAEFMSVVENWLRGQQRELRDCEIEESLNLARRLKKNTQQNGMRDVDILTRVVEKVR